MFTHGINFYSICALIFILVVTHSCNIFAHLCAYMLLEGWAYDISITNYTYRLTTQL